MGIIIQKYGGSSVSTPDKIRAVAQRIAATSDRGHHVCVVVSAMGNTTNELLGLARSVSPAPQRRELDMLVTVGERISMALLSMALHDLGYPAVSFTGSQSGIITTADHTNARIIRITPYRIQQALENGSIVIVAGFQGVSEHKEITSLGRGGSDTTAVALAAALNADYAEICSDVDGVYSADPRVVGEAIHQKSIEYSDMQAFADAGAKVLHADAVEWAKRAQIDVRCVATHDGSDRFTQITKAPSTHDFVGVAAHGDYWIFESRGRVRSQELDAALAQLSEFNLEGLHVEQRSDAWRLMFSVKHESNTQGLRQILSNLAYGSLRDDCARVTLVGRRAGHDSTLIHELRNQLNLRDIEVLEIDRRSSQLSFLVLREHGDTVVSLMHEHGLRGIQEVHEVESGDD